MARLGRRYSRNRLRVLGALLVGVLGGAMTVHGVARAGSAGQAALPAAPAGPIVVTIGSRQVDARTLSVALGSWRTPGGGPYDRRGLVQEVVRRELFSRFARARGLDHGYGVKQALRHYYEKKLLRGVQKRTRGPSQVSSTEMKQYFDSHRADFEKSPRRRVAAIELSTRTAAESVLAKAQKADAAGWASLVGQSARGRGGRPEKLAGYLGEVPPFAPGSRHPRVPPEVQKAAYRIPAPGQVHPEVVNSKGRFYVVKLLGVKAGSNPELPQVEHLVREQILGARVAAAEARFESLMLQRFPVRIVTKNLKLIETLR